MADCMEWIWMASEFILKVEILVEFTFSETIEIDYWQCPFNFRDLPYWKMLELVDEAINEMQYSFQ